MDTALNLGKQGGILTGWRAGIIAFLAAGPAVVLAALNQDTVVIFSGMACGLFFAVWGIWNFGATQMLKTMNDRLHSADQHINELRRVNQALAEEHGRLRVQLAEFEEASSDEIKVPRERKTS